MLVQCNHGQRCPPKPRQRPPPHLLRSSVEKLLPALGIGMGELPAQRPACSAGSPWHTATM